MNKVKNFINIIFSDKVFTLTIVIIMLSSIIIGSLFGLHLNYEK